MATTEKISVAIGRNELRLARTAAKAAGLSLSAFVSGAVRGRIEDLRRLDAARQVLSTFAEDELPTDAEQGALLAGWSAPSVRTRKRLHGRR